VLQM
jgi:hypothetical protein